MKIINKEVKHSVFGKGKILNQEGDRLSVEFSESYGIRQFGYPEVFEKHLIFSNADLETAVLKELSCKQETNMAEKVRKQQEYEENKITEAMEMAELKKKKAKKVKV